jgi:putative lysine transport system substrate-binding protein
MKLLKNAKPILAVMAAVALLSSCAKTADAPPTEANAALRVGMECAYAPFNWTQLDDSNDGVPVEGGGYAGGYDVEIARRIADDMGRELVVVKTEWDGLLPSLTSGKIDLIIAGMSPTDERKQSIDFSDYYYTSEIVLVLKKDSPYVNAQSIRDFAGAKVTGQLGTIHYDFLDQMPDISKQPAMDDFPTMIVALESGKIDAYASERPGAESAVASNPNLTYLSFPGDDGFQISADEVSISVGLVKNSPLLAPINAALAKISEDERQQIMLDALANQPSAE